MTRSGQPSFNVPMPSVFAHGLLPVREMGGERIEVQRQAIAGDTCPGAARQRGAREMGSSPEAQAADQLMNELIGQGLSAWAQRESWDDAHAGASVAGDPQPGSFGNGAEL